MLIFLYYLLSVIFTYYLIKIVNQYVFPYLTGEDEEEWDWESIKACFFVSASSFVGLFGFIFFMLGRAIGNKIKHIRLINKDKPPPRWL